jgi:hypothetical protein
MTAGWQPERLDLVAKRGSEQRVRFSSIIFVTIDEGVAYPFRNLLNPHRTAQNFGAGTSPAVRALGQVNGPSTSVSITGTGSAPMS